jgi:hypothetical protein
MEDKRLKMEPRRVYRSVVADSHDFDKEQDLESKPGPQQSEKLDSDPH